MLSGKYIKTAQYAALINRTQRTVIKNFHKGLIPGYQDKVTKTIYIENPEYKDNRRSNQNRVILYARVSSQSNRKSLDGQIERMRSYAAAKGYQIVREVKEVGSGLNDHRKKLGTIFREKDFDILLCEHHDRLTRFGYDYIKDLFARDGIKVESINEASNKDSELLDDFVSVVTSFCQRIYGRRRKKKTQKIIEEIKNDKG